MSVTGVQTERQTPLATSALHATAERRGIMVGLQQLARDVGASTQSDSLTQELQRVLPQVVEKARGVEDLKPLKERLTTLLQRALVQDPFVEGQESEPVARPMLGNDGELYDFYILSLFYHGCTKEQLTRSPHGSTGFSVEPHHAVDACLTWLDRDRQALENPIYRLEYERLERLGMMLPLPNGNNDLAREMFWEQTSALINTEQQLQEVRDALARIAGMPEGVELSTGDLMARLGQMVLDAEEEQRAREERNQALEAKIDQFEQGNRALERECEELKVVYADKERSIAELNQTLDELDEAIEEARRQIRSKRGLQIVSFAVNVAFSVATGGAFFASLVKEVGQCAISHGVSALVKNRQFASIISGGVNGGVFNGGLTNVIKGSALPVVDIVSQQAFGEIGAGVTHAVAATGMYAPSELGKKGGWTKTSILGAASGGLSKGTGVGIDISTRGDKVNMYMKV